MPINELDLAYVLTSELQEQLHKLFPGHTFTLKRIYCIGNEWILTLNPSKWSLSIIYMSVSGTLFLYRNGVPMKRFDVLGPGFPKDILQHALSLVHIHFAVGTNG